MIFTKFTRNVKAQNWLGVVLDFLVVVIGIFVGLQAADWNQSRLDKEEEKYHLQFLYEELVQNEKDYLEELKGIQGTLDKSFLTSQLLTQDSWDQEQRKQFGQSLFALFSFWGKTFRPVSLRRMVDDGKLDLVASKPLQKAILKFENAYLEAIKQTNYSQGMSKVITPKISASIKFVGMNIVSTNDALLDSSVLRSSVRDKAILQRIQLDTLNSLQKERIKLITVLKDVVSL
ncbi:hypothetical protein [Paraglaciecola sp.]|uniref:hypothetical protein n=1 Tax=Paraglaciecola sp. TaxID=1920173 RepID=UPI003EF841B8